MVKQKYIKNAILIIITAILFLIIIQPITKADFNPDDYQITPSEEHVVENQFDGIRVKLIDIGETVSLVALLLIGIRFMTGSLEERAEYKQRMVPYVIGCIFVFSISSVVGIVRDFSVNTISSGDIGAIGGQIRNIVESVAKTITTIILILLGIKYMAGGVEDKSEIKASMLPYVIGAMVVYAVDNISAIAQQKGAEIVSTETIPGIASNILSIVLIVGQALPLVFLAILGIKYLMGSVEEKAEFKRSMFPYVLGATLAFEALVLAPMIGGIGTDIIKGNDIGVIIRKNLYSIIYNAGKIIAGIMITVLGIKYMMGSTEERSQYKKSLIPYIVGAVIVFATSSVLEVVEKIAEDTVGTGGSIAAIGNKIGEIIAVIGSLLSVIILIALGIKYMFSGTEERAEYKKSLSPYIIGALVVFGTTGLKTIIQGLSEGLAKDGNIETIGQQIISVISVIGSIASVAMLVTIGIRMMMSGTSERAEYKKSLTPYIIGASIVFSASQLAGIIYQIAAQF